MQWNSKPLYAMDMSQARRIGDDCIRHEGSPPIIHRITQEVIHDMMKMRPIARFKTGVPTSVNNLPHFSSTLLNRPTSDSFEFWDQSRVPHHKRHQLCRVSANAEKFEALGENDISESEMSSKSNTMSNTL